MQNISDLDDFTIRKMIESSKTLSIARAAHIAHRIKQKPYNPCSRTFVQGYVVQRISKTVFILLIIGFGVFNFISISYPTIEVNITEINVDLTEQWFDVERDVRYPVTVENKWNHSEVYNDVISDECYIYWVIPVHEDREVDFLFIAPFENERYVFNETEFTVFRWGLGIDGIVEKYEYNEGASSFVCNSSGEYSHAAPMEFMKIRSPLP